MGLTRSDGSSDVSVSPMSTWYLVQCKPRQDGRAEEHLTRQGYMCCRPMHDREKIIRGRRQVLSESLFPGYLFIQISDDESWSPLRSTRGVSHVVKFGGKPLAVNDRLVSQFQNYDGGLSVVFRAGDRVRILDDGFADVEAIFKAATGDERVVLLIKLLNRAQELTLPLKSVASY
ncbi:transcription/translation regulatory transformer protein RfaH [Pseudomonas brenneri]|uniref:transcription/translation regulatory transformer protein RfaH n=1 Tax=Pseudomonas brenneri TaxID=129817 RepID=UPI003570E04E